MKPKRMGIATLLVAMSVAMVSCESKHAAVEWQGYILQEVPALAELPAAVQSELGVGRPGTDGVADRGRPFNVTDVVMDNLPMRRFLTAGRDGDTWLVALERGGRAYNVEVFLYSTPGVTLKQRWVLLDHPKSLADVVQQLSREEQLGD